MDSRDTIPSNVIQQKALKFADKLKQGYLIKEHNKRGESQSAPIEQIPEVREELKDVLKKCRKENIFNCDETGGHYWKMEPTHGLSTTPCQA
ncbi:17376_t:CDS:2 [Entrophospora sp. SA101]|nr:17376_t:CDS:2 [Entrophospora sp. SA101]